MDYNQIQEAMQELDEEVLLELVEKAVAEGDVQQALADVRPAWRKWASALKRASTSSAT